MEEKVLFLFEYLTDYSLKISEKEKKCSIPIYLQFTYLLPFKKQKQNFIYNLNVNERNKRAPINILYESTKYVLSIYIKIVQYK